MAEAWKSWLEQTVPNDDSIGTLRQAAVLKKLGGKSFCCKVALASRMGKQKDPDMTGEDSSS